MCDKSNYRHISVQTVIPRAFEKLVFDQFYQCLDKNLFLSIEQYGFREFHPTLTSLLKCTDDFYNGLGT